MNDTDARWKDLLTRLHAELEDTFQVMQELPNEAHGG